jgi:hypothetical protein
VQRHLEKCGQCAAQASADIELDNALRTATLEESPDASAVLSYVQKRMATPWWKRLPRHIPARMAAVMALIVILSIGLPKIYVHQMQRSIALDAAYDHYSDLTLLRHADWEYTPEDVAHFMREQFPGKHDLLRLITPDKSSFEKVRICNLRGVRYAHFVFKTSSLETSVFLLLNPERTDSYQAAHLSGDQHGLEVSGFSSAGLTGIVVGKQGLISTTDVATRVSKTLRQP